MHHTAATSPLHQILEATFTQLVQDYRNPAVAPFSPAPLIQALDAVLPGGGQRFTGNQQACAIEFLEGMLSEVWVAPSHIVTYEQEGLCTSCNRISRQVRIN